MYVKPTDAIFKTIFIWQLCIDSVNLEHFFFHSMLD